MTNVLYDVTGSAQSLGYRQPIFFPSYKDESSYLVMSYLFVQKLILSKEFFGSVMVH